MCATTLKDPRVALSHAAYHSVATPQSMLHPEPCPLCFGPSADCCPYLMKTSSGTLLQPRVLCLKWAPTASVADPERGVSFQAASLAKSTKAHPSTNRPIVCPMCHPELAEDAHKKPPATRSSKRKTKIRPAVWSYNMRAHWNRAHHSSVMPDGLSKAIQLAEAESRMLLSNRGGPVS